MSEAKRAAESGVHLYSTLIEIPCPLSPDDHVYELLDNRLQVFLEADPQAYVMPRLVFVPAPGWMRQYPHEVTHYADGVTADPSIASHRYWADVEHALAAVIDHLQKTNYGERVFGYHLERGEWFNPADNGYDRSFANREAFRDWLRAKYKNSVVALRAAWYDGDVQFHTAEIPQIPAFPHSEMFFFEPRKERKWIDFLEYTSDIMADRIISLSKVVKQATANKALVSVCYGYTFEFDHTFSGHLALGRILAAPTIDLICGPPTYKERQPGQAGSLPGPVDSMQLHGKLWISEDDTKTYLALANSDDDDFNPRLDSQQATDEVHLRAIGQAMAHQSGIAWMDLWGEGWLDADDIWKRTGVFSSRYSDFLKTRKPATPEVAVIIGERSLIHVQRGSEFIRKLLAGQREAIERSGASVGFYLQSDLTSKNFPTDARLYLFLTPYRLTTEQRAAIKDNLQDGGKTLVWMYAVGVCDERGQPEESAHELIGISLRQQAWSSESGSKIVDTRHPITERVASRELGSRERINPTFYVDDEEPGLTVLAEYVQSGLPSMAVRENYGWKSVFCGEPILTNDLFRGLCKYAGVHLYTPFGEDYVTAGYGWVSSHTTREGNRTLLLPPRCSLYDLIEGKLVGEDISEYKAYVKSNTTRLFYVGTVEDMRKLGLPGTEKTRGRRTVSRRKPAAKLDAVEEQEPLIPSEPVDEELESSEAADGETDDTTATADGNETAAQRARRRRRRGGRGRGRRAGHGGTHS